MGFPWTRRKETPVKFAAPPTDIDSEQRWLVRCSGGVIDATIGEVSGSGKWLKWKASRYGMDEGKWHNVSDYDWMEQLI